MAWDKQYFVGECKSNMDINTSEYTKSPPEASIERVEARNTADKALSSSGSSHHRTDSQESSGDFHNNEQIDPEVNKSCEAQWLQLFQLVERQCQEQMDAQQEQFSHQLQLIHEEIKRLAQLQGSRSPWNCGAGNAILSQAVGALPPCADAGPHSQDEERSESTSNAFHLLGEPDIQKKAFITQAHCQESTSISSGYGTLSASEPNACLSSFCQNTSRKTSLPTQHVSIECRNDFLRQPQLTATTVDIEKPFMLVPETKPLIHLVSSSEGSNEKRIVSPTNQPNSKPLTTWAQKLRQTHQKRSVQIEQSSSTQSNPQSERGSDNTDRTSNMFFLNNRAESANSLLSTGSGFTYWMMDEKDLYHPLPDNLETGVSKLFNKKESDQAKIPSLTDIYHQKQREHGDQPAWEPIPPSEHTHPPEILTLDPTLHKKHLCGVSLCNESYTAPLTPDSILESAYKQYDGESLSAASSMLGDSPNRSSYSPVADVEAWKSITYPTRRNLNYQPRKRGASIDEQMNCTEDDVNSLTTSSMPQSPLPATEQNLTHPPGALFVDHPVMLSNIRRSLREKHARHLADLRDYYESEISNLKQQLVASNKSTTTSEDLIKINSLTERCAHMEDALVEASKRIHVLENKNNELENQVAEWKERYYSASNTSKDLQEHIEEMRTKSKEKENAISRLQTRLKEVEGSFEKAFKQSDEKDERIKAEHKMFQDLLLEYESLGKEHERVKDTLGMTENKLYDAQTEVNELRRTVSKLETQIKQLEHENVVKLRHIAQEQSWSSSLNKHFSHTAGSLHTADTVPWKSVTSGTQCALLSSQPADNKAIEMEKKHDTPYVPNRYHTPPEKDALHNHMTAKSNTENSSTKESPILKALRDFEEEKGLKDWNKESSFHRLSSKQQTVGFSDSCTSGASPDKRDRQKHLSSPGGPRSSSLPPSIRKAFTVTTPTKRELMLTPMQVKYSPKRSPSENLSPGLSQLLCDKENTMTRFDVAWSDSLKIQDPSPRKRLQFMSLEDSEGKHNTFIDSEDSGESQTPLVLPPFETEITYNERMKNIGDTERLFDELSEEKKQIEAALSRIPSVGRRMSLQTRTMKENLEDRLEKINRDLGSIRITLKKYHILPTSANN